MKIAAWMMSALVMASVPVYGGANAPEMFGSLKKLAGTWTGRMSTTPKSPDVEGTLTTVTMRVTSMGHVLMHEMKGEGRPDNPITMLYLDDDRLALTHYCDAGNRPRMLASEAQDGKSVQFEFLDVAGPMQYGSMRRARFTFVDADHHIEEWTFMLPDGTPVVARVELQRTGQSVPVPVSGAAHKH